MRKKRENIFTFLRVHVDLLVFPQVNVDNPDTVKFPLFSKACWMECVLEPGQMLYIPPKCWHFVKSLDTSFSVSFWWE